MPGPIMRAQEHPVARAAAARGQEMQQSGDFLRDPLYADPEAPVDTSKGQHFQPTPSLDRIMSTARVTQPALLARLHSVKDGIADEHTKVLEPAVKSMRRAREKVDHDYEGNAARITDITRGAIQVRGDEQLAAARRQISSQFDVVEEKDRYAKEDPGYKDVNYRVRMGNGMLGEVQLQTEAMHQAKEIETPIYERVRTLRTQEPTEAIQDEIEQLTKKSEFIYGWAREKSAGGQIFDEDELAMLRAVRAAPTSEQVVNSPPAPRAQPPVPEDGREKAIRGPSSG